MPRYVLWLVLLTVLTPATASAQAELLVRLRDGLGAAHLQAIRDEAAQPALASMALRPVAQSRSDLRGPIRFPAYVAVLADSAALRDAEEVLADDPGIAYVQRNVTYTVDGVVPADLEETLDARWGDPARFLPTRGVDDPLLDSLTHLPVIRARQAWQVTTGTPDVRVGVLDTGIWTDHPDLRGQMAVNPGEDANGNGRFDPFPTLEGGDLNGADDDGNGLVDDVSGYDFVHRPDVARVGDYLDPDPDASIASEVGPQRDHGTVVAGVLAAARGNGEGGAGVAPGIRLVPLRAFGADGVGDTDDIVAALVYAADEGLDVVNLSFGRDVASPMLEEAIRYAVDRGVVVVASAGNSTGDDPHYPSDYPEVISVVGLDARGEGLALLSTYGLGVDLGAPSVQIYTTQVPASLDGSAPAEALYGRSSGSSVAAPQVAGAAALVRSLDSELDPAAVRTALTASATDIGGPGWDHRTGAGRLDVAAALGQALPARVAVRSPRHNDGTAEGVVPIVGTAVDPAFARYRVEYAYDDTVAVGRDDFDWLPIAGPVDHQVVNDTLAVWSTEALPDSVYTLRLVVERRDGTTVEDRRRLYVDRTPPELSVRFAEAGLVDGRWGIVADVTTDDLTTLTVHVGDGTGRPCTEDAEHRARRHGVYCARRLAPGPARVRLEATNTAGATTSASVAVDLPADVFNARLYDETVLGVPRGYLMPTPTDFDGDGLQELTMNVYDGEAFGDTVRTYEWDGDGFAPAHDMVGTLIPRDAADTDGNGRTELLLSRVGVTVLVEPSAAGGFPDTERLRLEGLSGALLDDLDGDGLGEVVAHDGAAWVVLEYDQAAATWRPVARLENPTTTAGSREQSNGFERIEALAGDFDADGRRDLLVGDVDGDWIVYEATGDDTYAVRWTYETDRYNAGARFARGDFDGDGVPEFVTYTDPFQGSTREEDPDPAIGRYYLWEHAGDDAYRLVRTIPIPGAESADGALAAADLDGDGRDELVVAHPPALYVMEREEGQWTATFHRSRPSRSGDAIASRAVLAADLDGDGLPSALANTAAGPMRGFMHAEAARWRPPARWVAARALEAGRVRLIWEAPGTDSVGVYEGAPGGALDWAGSTTATELDLEAASETCYRLRAWYGPAPSPLSAERCVRPHPAAVVTDVTYPDSATVRIVFSEPISDAVRAEQFELVRGERSPRVALPGAGGRALALRFGTPPTPREDTLHWKGLVDASGMPVPSPGLAVAFPEAAPRTLVLSSWTLGDDQAVTLVFDEPVGMDRALDPSSYAVEPSGRVGRVEVDPEDASRLTVFVEGTRIGAVGRSTVLRIQEMEGRSGSVLPEDGYAVQLTRPAEGLADVFVYPNPYHAGRNSGGVTIAGLPTEATVQILSAGGALVRRLEETDRDGGVQWSLTDRSGQAVPSGVYFVRVEAPRSAPVLKKVAVIR